MLLASYLTRPTRVGNKPSQGLISERSSPARRHMIVTRQCSRRGNSALAVNARTGLGPGAAQNTQTCASNS
jgi:hypothetical protein